MKSIQKKLSADFQARNQWFTNRASAVFPIYLHTTQSDVRIVFLNYFLIKNKIEDLTVNYRVYDQEGVLFTRLSETVRKEHNEFSVRSVIENEVFEGMIEVEFISTENLKFSFPGIVALYKAGELVSSVHSAGRIRNADEAYQSSVSPETNWSCKYGENVSPFFHVFNGARQREECLSVEVEIYSEENDLLHRQMVETGVKNSFSSEVILLKDIYEPAGESEVYVVVNVPSADNFPRMVVGNYFQDMDFMEATHSFARVEINDYIDLPDDDRIPTLLSLLRFDPLSLEAVIFPTNAESSLEGLVRKKREDEDSLGRVEEKHKMEIGAKGGKYFKYNVNDDEELCVLSLSGKHIPSRINCSFRYSLKGAASRYSTDIASGFKSWIYPDKYNHWGYGVVSNDFETMVMIRNISHKRDSHNGINGKLYVYGPLEVAVIVDVSVPFESVEKVLISEWVPELISSENPQSISWYLEMDAPRAEVFWLSFADDGRILGDHAF